jgi:hypothetical protein
MCPIMEISNDYCPRYCVQAETMINSRHAAKIEAFQSRKAIRK